MPNGHQLGTDTMFNSSVASLTNLFTYLHLLLHGIGSCAPVNTISGSSQLSVMRYFLCCSAVCVTDNS